ncbi:class I SAM-dependent methyltransferase [Candidatus Poribacteria bacterium]|nr:class I SAM-dependent methyltransferase [Candidatus Poribacteria bacterium]
MADVFGPDGIRGHYDELAGGEWDRLVAPPADEVKLHVHAHYLRAHIAAGSHVLDIGAGPGRFTIELARLGARVTVADISPVQLSLNRERVAEAGHDDAVVGRYEADVSDLARFATAAFDATVCYGGPLSCMGSRLDDAIDELLRVTKPGGPVLMSVMSLVGSSQTHLGGIFDVMEAAGRDIVDAVATRGDIGSGVRATHHMHMFRWSELRALLQRHGCEIVAASASNCLSVGNPEPLARIRDDHDAWEMFLRWELDYCREPGAIDAGTHIIAVARRA